MLRRFLPSSPTPKPPARPRPARAILLLLTALTLGSGSPAQAAELGNLTLESAIQLAVARNPSLESAAEQVTESRLQVQQARDDFLPQASASLSSLWQLSQKQADLVDSASSLGLSGDISASVNLFSGFSDTYTLKASLQSLEASQATRLRTQEQVAFEAASRFLQLASDEAQLQVMTENLHGQQLLLERVQALVKAGSKALADQYQQEATTRQAELDLLNALRIRELDRLKLLQTLGCSASDTFQLVQPDPETQRTLQQTVALEKALEVARAHRADLQAQRRSLEAARTQVQVAAAGYLPTLTLSGGLSTQFTSAASASFSDQLVSENLGGTLSMNLSIPLFDQHRTRNNVARARSQQRQAELNLTRLELQVEVELGQALGELNSAGKRLEVTASQVQSARQALEVSQSRYGVGAGTLVEVTQARASFVQASYQQVDAMYDLALQRLALAYYQGTLGESLALAQKER